MSRILQRVTYSSQPFLSSISTLSHRYLSAKDDKSIVKPSKTEAGQVEPKKSEAVNKLNSLLQDIIKGGQESKHSLSLAKPRPKRPKIEPAVESAKVDTAEKKLLSAVKGVAESLGGNMKQTESELLSKLVNADDTSDIPNLSEIVRGMKIDREIKTESTSSKAHVIRSLMKKFEHETSPSSIKAKQTSAHRVTKKPVIDALNAKPVDIFGAKPLGIFNTDEPQKTNRVMNPTWDILSERELKLAITHPPLNYFQEQILWTEQGKIWKFPIDNEQGMEDEQNVNFAEHVFLEEHLSPWCPTKGPLRHFMELVCVGLSKNPYMSVQDKKEHIQWYKNYFEEKQKLLKETGALPDVQTNNPHENELF